MLQMSYKTCFCHSWRRLSQHTNIHWLSRAIPCPMPSGLGKFAPAELGWHMGIGRAGEGRGKVEQGSGRAGPWMDQLEEGAGARI